MTSLRVGFVNAGYFDVTQCFLDHWDKCHRPGYEIEIFTVIMRLMGIKNYTFVESPTYGYQVNGTWNGLVEMARIGEIDVATVSLRATVERSDIVHFAYPIWFYQEVFYYLRPSDHPPIINFFLPFDSMTWVLLALSSVIYGLFINVRSIGGQLIVFPENWLVYSIIQNIWQISYLHYQAFLSSCLAVLSIPEEMVTSTSALIRGLEDNRLHLVYSDDSGALPSCLNDESCDAMRSALQHNPIRVVNGAPLAKLHEGDVHFTNLNKAFVPYKFSSDHKANSSVVISHNREIPIKFGSFLIGKNMSKEWRQAFDEAIIEMKDGVSRFATQYSDLQNPPAYAGKHAVRRVLSMTNLRQTIVILAGGYCLSAGVFVVELNRAKF